MLACLLGAPGAALAGPNLIGEFRPFPLTSMAWMENTRGPGRTVHFTPVDDGRNVRWHVRFRSRAGSDFSQAEGVLALESAPRDCGRLALQVANVESSWSRTRFIPLHGTRQQDRVQDPGEAEASAAEFQELAKYPIEIPARWNCDAMQERCAGADVSIFQPGMRQISATEFESSPGSSMTFSCEDVDRSIAVCREWEAGAAARARAVAASPPPRCDGLLVAVRAEDGDSVELRAIGEDGADWGKVTVSPGFPMRPLAVVLAPLTVPADVVVMTFEGLLYGSLALLLAFY